MAQRFTTKVFENRAGKTLRLVLLVTLMAPAVVGAATYHATPSTINSIAAKARPGDVVLLESGTYGRITRVGSGTSWDNVVTIKAAPGANVRVAGIALTNTRFVSFEGFDIDGRLPGAGNDAVWFGQGASHIRVMNSSVHHARNQGVLVPWNGGGGHQFIGLKVYANGSRPHFHHGIYIATSNNTLADSDVYGNAGYGVHFYASGKGGVSNNLVLSNRIRNNGTMGGTTYGLVFQDGTGNVAIGNTLCHNGTGDIHIGIRTTGTVLKDNSTCGPSLLKGQVSNKLPPGWGGGTGPPVPPGQPPPPTGPPPLPRPPLRPPTQPVANLPGAG